MLNTKQVRAIANTYTGAKWNRTTYTEKTSERNAERRTVVYCFWRAADADAFAGYLLRMGVTNKIKRTGSEGNLQQHIVGGEYVRIVANIAQ